MSEHPHTTGQVDPTQFPPTGEAIIEQALHANANAIIAATKLDAARLLSRIHTVPRDGVEWKSLKSQLDTIGQAKSFAYLYGIVSSDQPDLTFGRFLSEQMERVDINKDFNRYKILEQTEKWFDTQTSHDQTFLANVLRDKQEQQTIEQQPTPRPETTPPRDPQAEAVRQKQTVADARRSVEQARGAELITDIVKLGKNRTLLHADVARGFKDVGDGLPAEKRLVSLPGWFVQNFERTHKATDWRQELNETVMFSDVVERDYRTVTTQQEIKVGRFGRKRTIEETQNETVPGSERPKMIRNELTDQDEPAVRLNYAFNLRSHKTGLAVHTGELPKYLEFGGLRDGQMIEASVELPKSIADQLQKLARENPQSIRSLVEQLFLSNSDGTITEEAWHQGHEQLKHPIRPPYEQLPVDWTMAIVTKNNFVNSKYEHTIDYDIDRVRTQQKVRLH